MQKSHLTRDTHLGLSHQQDIHFYFAKLLKFWLISLPCYNLHSIDYEIETQRTSMTAPKVK